jgi:hypothetical protein
MERLGRNHGRYHGETIEIQDVFADVEAAARAAGWTYDPIEVAADTRLPAYRRVPALARRRVYLSSGIHGDEPAGPLAVRRLLASNAWPPDVALWLVPSLNPGGFVRNTRENEAGVDLNRDYRSLATPVVCAHVAWLNRQPSFDLALLLHEDWEAQGFYLYELNPRQVPSLAEAIVRRVREVCPIDPSPLIDGRPAEHGIIRPAVDPAARPDWPEALYLIAHKSRLNYTLEAPSDYRMDLRVQALVEAVQAALDALEATPS